MTARDEAIAAMLTDPASVDWAIGAMPPLPLVDVIGGLLDAIPASVLARLAIERGGLTPAESHHDSICSWRIWTDHEDLFDGEPECDCTPVYRLTEVTP